MGCTYFFTRLYTLLQFDYFSPQMTPIENFSNQPQEKYLEALTLREPHEAHFGLLEDHVAIAGICDISITNPNVPKTMSNIFCCPNRYVSCLRVEAFSSHTPCTRSTLSLNNQGNRDRMYNVELFLSRPLPLGWSVDCASCSALLSLFHLSALLNIVIFPQGSYVYESKEKGRAISDDTNPHLVLVQRTGANLSERQNVKTVS